VAGHAPSYLTGMLIAVTDERVLRRYTSSVEPAANRTQVDAFHASFQALLENILLQDCLL